MTATLTKTNKKNRLLVEAYSHSACRVRETQNSEFKDFDDALILTKALECSSCEVHQMSITTDKMKVEIDERGYLDFYKKGESEPRIGERKSPRALHEGGRSLKSVHGELYKAEVLFEAYEDEKIWGMGQHQYNALDQKGLVLPLNQMNSQVSVPFYISSRGYGLFWNNPGVGHVEFARNRTKFVMSATSQIDYFIIIADSPSEILEEYYALTGYPSPLPAWSTGFWQCKLRYENQEELLNVAREYKKRNLPISAIVIDYFHWEKQGNWDFDKKCWPEPEKMVKELTEMGIETLVSVWPTVNPDSLYFDEMEKSGYLIEAEKGNAAFMRFTDTYEKGVKYLHYYDATNPEAREFLWEKLKKSYIDRGIKSFWLDACEPEVLPYDYENLRYFRGNGAAVSSIYPLLHEKTIYENMIKEGIERPLNLCRSAWCGSQKYGVLVWSGDIDSTFESLEVQMKAGLNMVTSGIPWWTTDIGGFSGGNIEDDTFRELIVRWFQFGLYSPIFRLHGLRDSWDPKKGADNEVWSFGEKAYTIITKLLHLRESLRPYIESEAHTATTSGKPLMRPLFFDYHEDKEALKVEDQFMFGSDILACPIVKMGQRERSVYLPKGNKWINAFTKEVFEGGEHIMVQAPLEHIPTFLKEGSSLLSLYDLIR